MIEVTKSKTDIGYKVQITKDNNSKILSLLLTLENDLLVSILDRENPAIFNINLSDENLYLVIDKLFNNIKRNSNEDNKLYQGDMVDYHSDESEYNIASRLIIKQNQHDYDLIITENKQENTNNTVIISNKSLRYTNDNQAFFEMFDNLNNYDLKTRKLIK